MKQATPIVVTWPIRQHHHFTSAGNIWIILWLLVRAKVNRSTFNTGHVIWESTIRLLIGYVCLAKYYATWPRQGRSVIVIDEYLAVNFQCRSLDCWISLWCTKCVKFSYFGFKTGITRVYLFEFRSLYTGGQLFFENYLLLHIWFCGDSLRYFFMIFCTHHPYTKG